MSTNAAPLAFNGTSATFNLLEPKPEQISRAETLLFGDIAPSVRAMGRAVEAAQAAARHAGNCHDEARNMGPVCGDENGDVAHWTVNEFGTAFGVAALALDAVAKAHRDLAELGLKFARTYEEQAQPCQSLGDQET